MREENLNIAIINKTGDVLCVIDKGFVFLPLKDVTLDNIFLFWSRDLSDLEEYFYNLYSWRTDPDPTLNNLDLSECSILDVKIDRETEDFWFE